jgi:serine-type D-Ala-D-Ala carboxypeptidase/endopeptidase (penicillin-binding protein 4)
MKKLAIAVILLCVFSVVSFAQNYTAISETVAQLSKSKTLEHAEWSVYAEYANSGKEIVSYNSEKSMAPASGLKVFTTSAALNLLGEDYRFETKLYYEGIITDKGALEGNIYIVGGGDPTLGSNLVKGSLPLDSLMQSWVNAISAKGIKEIQGAIVADALLFDGKRVPDFWNWMDIGNYYGAGTSALTINDNLYYLYFHPSENVGDKAEVLLTEPVIPGLKFTNYMKTGTASSGDNGYIYAGPGQFDAVLRGTVPAGANEFSIKGSIPNPPLFAAQYLKQFLEKNNIKVNEDSKVLESPVKYDDNKLITVTLSPPLKDIVYITNKKSDNLYAEQLLKTIGLKMDSTGSAEAGITAITTFLKTNNISTDGFHIYDGCGLSRSDMITTKSMVQLLAFMTKQKVFKSFYSSLAVAGISDDPGYFKNFGKGTLLAGNARIKSGLITNVRSESGYVYDKAGRLIVFSMIANNYTGSSKDVDEIHKKILLELASLN